MSLVKIPFILLDAVTMRLNATPPNPPSPLSEHVIPDWRERFLKSLAWPSALLRTTYWFSGLIEVLTIIAALNPSGPISRQLLATLVLNGACPRRIFISPSFLLGTIITFCGTTLRLYSFRTLGTLFTFELCIRNDHRLVVDGPYNYVRHPSYTGLILSIIGALCSHLSGSWVKECGILDTTLGLGIAFAWLSIAAAVVLSLLLRIPREDELLRREFGNEWLRWTERVPYRLVPGLY